MTNVNLNGAVDRLIADRRFLARFRRNPGRALEGFDLSPGDVEALKRGDPDELVALGLDPRYVSPEASSFAPVQSWALRNARRLPAAALLAAALLGVGGFAGRDAPTERARRAQRRSLARERAARATPRHLAARATLRHQRVALARQGSRALRRA